MAKTKLGKIAPTVETVRPYLDRALRDPEFRSELKEALEAAKKLYGPLVKDNGGLTASASKLATDAKVQEQLRKALEDFGKAADTLKGKKKGHKGRNTLLLAGLVAGAFYNPWFGQSSRDWLLDKIAGDDGLQPFDDYRPAPSEPAASTDADNGSAPAQAAAEESS